MVTQKCVGVTQKCVGWRMGDGLQQELLSATRDKARVSVARLGAGFIFPAIISDSPGFVRLLGSFGFPVRRVRSCWTDRKAVPQGAYADPGMARDVRREVGGGIERCAWPGEAIGFLRALRSSDSRGFLRVLGSFGFSDNLGSFGNRGVALARSSNAGRAKELGVTQPSSLLRCRNKYKKVAAARTPRHRRGCSGMTRFL
jgi:hypothetical protein